MLESMDDLPFVTPIYKRDLVIENYFGGYLKHPYISFYTGRGCKSRCTFCLWPQTDRRTSLSHAQRRSRHRRAEVGAEGLPAGQGVLLRRRYADRQPAPRVEALAREIGKLGITWSCNAKANVPRSTLKIMKDNGLRLLLVGYESGNQKILHNIKKGMLVDVARRFTKDCHELGIVIHGTFILGLPGETKETIEETIRFATEINPHTIQISLAAPYPGTFLHKQALENGWLVDEKPQLLTDLGTQMAALNYPHLSHTEIFEFGRGLLSTLLFPCPEDRVDRRRNGAQSRDDEASAARRR